MHPTQVLYEVSSVTSVGSDQFDTVVPEFCVQFVGIVSIIADQVLLRNNHLDQRRRGQGHFMRCGAFDAHSNGKPMAVCDCHDFASLAALRLADFGSPFLAGAKVPSMKAS